MSSFLQSFLGSQEKLVGSSAHEILSKRLRKYGLRYDDLYDRYYDLDIKEALNRLPREIVNARNQRLKRSMDLSMKHEYLPENLQQMQTPFRSYLQDMLALVFMSIDRIIDLLPVDPKIERTFRQKRRERIAERQVEMDLGNQNQDQGNEADYVRNPIVIFDDRD
ncbi:cytochrome b-c1 complex subunit 7-2, mitochondrial isoform X1 [Gossypium hirsutum]|uniref:Cytochrome b-c1 complex subunit 7-2, mitochondrial isoform X1 n=1 Tax=Gossypium hirsutum TaxID=3635 RepID=A0ABM3BGY3_GOSHI|nr:cytochrome b-c1 complex subunit 7-2, mitochondrial isoform X1 [Gossypium hirsutum]